MQEQKNVKTSNFGPEGTTCEAGTKECTAAKDNSSIKKKPNNK